MKNILCCLIFYAISLVCAAQNIEKMSLIQLDSMMSLLVKKGNPHEALPYAKKATEVAMQKGIDSLITKSFHELGGLYSKLGQYEIAESNFRQSLVFAKKAYGERHAEYASAINSLAIVLRDMGRYEEAEPLYLQTIVILKQSLGENHLYYAESLNNLANMYTAIDNLDAAEKLVLQSMEIIKKTVGTEHSSYGNSLNSLALLYHKMKKYEEAEQLFLQNIAIDKKTLDPKDSKNATGVNNLAGLYLAMQKYDMATKYYEQALVIIEKSLGKEHPNYATTLNNLAFIYVGTGVYNKAEQLFQQAMELRKNALGLSHPDYSTSLFNLAALYIRMKQYEASSRYFNLAAQSNCRQKEKVSTLLNMTDAEYYDYIRAYQTYKGYYTLYKQWYGDNKDKKYLDTAYMALRGAMHLNERIRNSFSSEADKLRTLSNMSTLVDNALETGMSINKNAYSAELFYFAELNKSILLTEALKSSKAKSLGSLPDSLALKETALQQKLSALKKQEIEAKTDEEKALVNKNINSVNLEIEAFKKQLEGTFKKYYELKYANNTIKAAEIKKLLDKKSALLEFFVANSRVYLFCITQKQFEVFTIEIDKKTLGAQIAKMRKALSDYDFIKQQSEESYKLYTETAYWFYKNIVAPALETSKDIDNLIIVADGELGHLPFEAFLTEEIKTEKNYSELPYLLNKYKVSYNYSATLWKENLEKKIVSKNGKMLAVAAAYKGKEDSLRTRANRAPHLRNLRDALQDLPAAKQEVEALGKVFSGDFLYGDNAAEKTFKEKAAQYGIIHLAMHGILNQRAPILSSLAFTENGDSTEDNFLEAWEISHLKLNAQLVVLSACETGYGKFQQGEGVMSLARSFMYAGVPSLVVSLWQVNDASTSQIMQLFYKNLAKGMDKAAALRQAKLDYMKVVDNPNAAHPAFWAAFVLIGDERPIAIATKGGGLMWYLIGGVGLLAVIGSIFILRRKEK